MTPADFRTAHPGKEKMALAYPFRATTLENGIVTVCDVRTMDQVAHQMTLAEAVQAADALCKAYNTGKADAYRTVYGS